MVFPSSPHSSNSSSSLSSDSQSVEAIQVVSPKTKASVDLPESLDKNHIPTHLTYRKAHTSRTTNPVWDFFYRFTVPYKGNSLICIPCIRLLDGTNVSHDTFEKCLLKDTKNTTNLKTHLKRVHYNCACPDERVVEFLSPKKAIKQVLQFQKKSVSPSNSLKKFLKSDVDIFKERVYKFIVYNSIPFNVINSDEFKEIGKSVYHNYSTMSRATFCDFLDSDVRKFFSTVNTFLEEACIANLGQKFITIIHDMCTGKANQNYLGVSISFLHNFDLHRIGILLIPNNFSHGAEFNSNLIDEKLKERFSFDFSEKFISIVSDTTNSATAVARYLDVDSVQTDCDMHQLNTSLKVAFGLIESTRTRTMRDGNGNKIQDSKGNGVKETIVVTPGGEFSAGKVLECKLRSIANYFNNPQRLQRLRDYQENSHLPVGCMSVPGVTRISSTYRLIQESLFHFYSLSKYSTHVSHILKNNGFHHDSAFVEKFEAITMDEWEGLTHMEAVASTVAKIASSEAQVNCVMPAWMLYTSKKCRRAMAKDTFHILEFRRRPPVKTTFTKFISAKNRYSIELNELNSYGTKCKERLMEQIKKRLPVQSTENCLDVYLDPRAIGQESLIINNDILTSAREYFVAEVKRVIALIESHDSSVRKISFEISSDDKKSGEHEIDSDDEDRVIKKRKVEIKVYTNSAEYVCKKWLELDIDWSRYLKKNVKEEDVKKNKKLDYLSGIFECADPLKWYREDKLANDPTLRPIRILASCQLAKISSGSFQETVFSSGKLTMGDLQTKMSNTTFERRCLMKHNKDFFNKFIR